MIMQPIETAPKDGTFIYLIGDSGYSTFPFRIQVGRWVKGFRDDWTNYADNRFTDGGDAPQFWAPILKDKEQYNIAICKLKEKDKKLDKILQERPEHSIQEEVEQEWIFTFCGDHAYPKGFVVIKGTRGSAREEMFNRFGAKWGFQYFSKEEAGVARFGLYKVK